MSLILQPLVPSVGRAVIIICYKNYKLLQEIARLVQQVNIASLPHAYSLWTYQLTDTERSQVAKIVDETTRTFILESRSECLFKVMRLLGRHKANGENYRVLYDPRVLFERAMYTSFNADLKTIRLRSSLATLLVKADVRDRLKVSKDVYDALQGLFTLRQLDRLYQAKQYQVFPSAEALISIESRYGETITPLDLFGTHGRSKDRRRPSTSGFEHTVAQTDRHLAGLPRNSMHLRSKDSTDTENPKFSDSLRHRTNRDFIGERKQASKRQRETDRQRKQARLEEERRDKTPATFQYSLQKLNYVELRRAALRAALAKKADTFFTYSLNYASLNFPLYETSTAGLTGQLQSPVRGKPRPPFMYPAPRDAITSRRHPRISTSF